MKNKRLAHVVLILLSFVGLILAILEAIFDPDVEADGDNLDPNGW